MDSMCMCGMEFCGNASRSFALLTAIDQGIQGFAHMEVNVSGMSEPAQVDVDTSSNYARIRMPLPLSVTTYTDTEIPEAEDGTLVDLDGIVHLVLHDVPWSKELFNRIRQEFYTKADPPAFGVMFVDSYDCRTTPLVYVRDVNSTYVEGSCGSGSTAVAIAHARNRADGEMSEDVIQPAGTVTTTVTKIDGAVTAVFIESSIGISPVREVEVEV
jgi:diaminopimelate epimerase